MNAFPCHRDLKRMSGCQELELQAVSSSPNVGLGTELGSSAALLTAEPSFQLQISDTDKEHLALSTESAEGNNAQEDLGAPNLKHL